DAGPVGRGELQREALVVPEGPQVDRLVDALDLAHAEDVDEGLDALVARRRQQLDVADVGDVVDGLRRQGTVLRLRACARPLAGIRCHATLLSGSYTVLVPMTPTVAPRILPNPRSPSARSRILADRGQDHNQDCCQSWFPGRRGM